MIYMERIIIAAVAENGVIGKEGNIPWHYPEDFKHFKETTRGHPVIMGRVTYDGIENGLGGPLPDRENIVLSREAMDAADEYENVVNVHSIDDALEAAEATGDDEVYIAGGASIYKQFLDRDLVDTMILTEIPESPDGDTYFPDWDEDTWKETDSYPIGDDLTVQEYTHADA